MQQRDHSLIPTSSMSRSQFQEQTASPIHEGPTGQHKGHEGSVVNILARDRQQDTPTETGCLPQCFTADMVEKVGPIHYWPDT